MSRIEAIRAKLPAPLRPFTRGVWPYVWIGVGAAGALVTLGGAGFDRASQARDAVQMRERLVSSMRTLIASEPAEEARAAALDEWLERSAPGRIVAPSVEIGVTRLRERIEAMAADAGEGVRLLPDRGVATQRETVVETMRDGRSLHLVRFPIEVESQTMAGLVRLLDRMERNDELWLRPANTTLQRQIGRRGESAVLRVSSAWAIIEVRPEGG